MKKKRDEVGKGGDGCERVTDKKEEEVKTQE